MKVTSTSRYLVCPLLLWFGYSCAGQAVTIRVVDAAHGHPLQKQRVSVTLFYDKGERRPAKYDATLGIETDASGEAHFKLPEPAPAHFAAVVHVDVPLEMRLLDNGLYRRSSPERNCRACTSNRRKKIQTRPRRNSRCRSSVIVF